MARRVMHALVLIAWITTVNATDAASRRLTEGCYLGRNIEFIGANLTSMKASSSDKCCTICRDAARCGAFTWSSFGGGTCWLKTAWESTQIVIGAESCWMPNEGQSPGQPFSNCDLYGNDIFSESGQPRASCAAACTKNPECKAVTWTNFKDGTCWYKNEVRECVELQGAESTVTFTTFVKF